MKYAESKPEATPMQAEDLLRCGDQAAVSRALSRRGCSERLLRICPGFYMDPIQTRFGLRAPSLEQAITTLASLWGEIIVCNGGDTANWRGLTIRPGAGGQCRRQGVRGKQRLRHWRDLVCLHAAADQ